MGVRTYQKGERKRTNKHKTTMAPGKRQKLRRDDDPLVPLPKATQVTWARFSKPCSGSIAAKNQPVSGQVVRWTSDVWKKEKQKSVLTRTGPNQNSLTGGDWESLMVSMEASHLEIQGGKGRDS